MPRNRRTLCGLLFCLLTALVVPTPARADEIDDALAQPADVALTQLTEWIEALEPQGTVAPRRLRLLRARAQVLMALGRPAAAVGDLEELAHVGAATPSDRLAHAQALYQAGLAEARRPQGGAVSAYFEDALEVLATVGVQGAGEPELMLRSADLEATLLEGLSRTEAALRVRLAVDLETLPEPWSQHWWDATARLHYALGQYEAAAEAFLASGQERAAAAAWDAAGVPDRSMPIYAALIAADPQNAELAQQALQGARYGRAVRTLSRELTAMEIPPAEAGLELLLLMATLFEEAAEPVQALALYEEAARRVPLDARGWTGIARCAPRTAEPADLSTVRAMDAWEKALLLAPEDEAAIEGLSWYAGLDYQRLWRLGPEHPVAKRCLRTQEALVTATGGEDAVSLGNLANTLRVLGLSEQAVLTYDRARQANPYDPDVTSDQGLALSAAGRDDQALAAFLAAIDLDPANLSARQNAARMLWRAGRDREAAEQMASAIRSGRALRRPTGVYRHLLDRAWRTIRDPNRR